MFMDRLDPHDLRVFVAAILRSQLDGGHATSQGRQDFAIEQTDKLLDALGQTDPGDEEAPVDLSWQLRARDDHNLRLLNENDSLHEECRSWAEAQDSLRSEWLKIIAALAEIVPEIPGETTLSMVGRIKASIAGINRNADEGPITLCMPGAWVPRETVEAEVMKERERIIAMVCTKGHPLLVNVPHIGAPYFDEKCLRSALDT